MARRLPQKMVHSTRVRDQSVEKLRAYMIAMLGDTDPKRSAKRLKKRKVGRRSRLLYIDIFFLRLAPFLCRNSHV